MFSLKPAHLLLILASLASAHALGVADDVAAHDGHHPRREAMVTAPARLGGATVARDLFGRQATDQQVIGYYEGDPADPASCGLSFSATFTSLGSGARFWGCCQNQDSCIVVTQCVDNGRSPLTTLSGSTIISSVAYCGSQSGATGCQTRYFIDLASDTFTLNFCGSTSGTLPAIYEEVTFTSTVTRTSTTTSTSSSRSTSSSTVSSSTSEASSQPARPSSTSPAISPPTGSAVETSSPPSSTNTGAIAGGVVGGVAALGLIAAGVAVLLRRKRKQRRLTANSNVSRYEPEQEPKYGRY